MVQRRFVEAKRVEAGVADEQEGQAGREKRRQLLFLLDDNDFRHGETACNVDAN